jgi:hypothetical protein
LAHQPTLDEADLTTKAASGRGEIYGLITPGKNPWFGYFEAQIFLAERLRRRAIDWPRS